MSATTVNILSAVVLLTDGADEILLELDCSSSDHYEGKPIASITASRDCGMLWCQTNLPEITPEVKNVRTKQTSGDVHTRHCCVNCGCKYGEDRADEESSGCSVTTGRKQQEHECSGDCLG